MDPSGIDKDRLIAKNRYECEMISIISGQLEDVYIYIREGGGRKVTRRKIEKVNTISRAIQQSHARASLYPYNLSCTSVLINQ